MLLKTAALAGCDNLRLVRMGFFRAPNILLAAAILAATSELSVAVESMVEPRVSANCKVIGYVVREGEGEVYVKT
jgi:hypothetical protein